MVRRSPHELTKEVPTSPEDLSSHDRNPFEAAVQAEDTKLVQDILLELDEPKREVLVLADLEDMTVPEIAEVLEINPNTARSRLAVAREEFEKKLALRLRSPAHPRRPT